MLRNFQPPIIAVDPSVQCPSWPEGSLNWAAGRLWWTDRDRSRWAIAQLDDDRVSDLSEVGRRIRRDIRRQHVCWQCKEKTMTTLSIPYERWPHWRSPRFMKAIKATIDTFREALEMRRAAHRRHRFIDE